MPEGYHHLTYEERCQITPSCKTASRRRHSAPAWRSSLDDQRELDRNTGARSYRFKQAQEKASQKRKNSLVCTRKMKPDLVN